MDVKKNDALGKSKLGRIGSLPKWCLLKHKVDAAGIAVCATLGAALVANICCHHYYICKYFNDVTALKTQDCCLIVATQSHR